MEWPGLEVALSLLVSVITCALSVVVMSFDVLASPCVAVRVVSTTRKELDA